MTFSKGAPSILLTDEVNRQGIRVPLGELVSGLEKSARFSIGHDLPFGVPSHIQHDMHRPLGWCTTTGILINSDLARQVGSVGKPQTDEDQHELDERMRRYWDAVDAEGVAPVEVALRERIGISNTQNCKSLRCEAAALMSEGLAAHLYPHLFTPDTDLVDKDGLVDFHALLKITRQVRPGVFLDPERGLILLAHPFFRRSMSRRNTLNRYFLAHFADYALANKTVNARLRLDPSLIGHPDTVLDVLEFEYWNGPMFNSDIHEITSGVSEHKADETTRHFEGVDKTQLWWKTDEQRKVNGEGSKGKPDVFVSYRTFEAEELIENPSHGISDHHFGCRYVHAEFSVNDGWISHFDGAIRAYDANDYFQRLDARIDRAGKRSDYTKLFRFDGPLAVGDWKALATNFFRGNPLVPEYFGAVAEPRPTLIPGQEPDRRLPPEVYRLWALVSFHKPSENLKEFAVFSDDAMVVDEKTVYYFEVPSPALQGVLFSFFDPPRGTAFRRCADQKLNFPHIIFGDVASSAANWKTCAERIAGALYEDWAAGELDCVSFCFDFMRNGLTTRLALAGSANCLVNLFGHLPNLVRPDAPAREWAEALKQAVHDAAVGSSDESEPSVAIEENGKLRVLHEGTSDLVEFKGLEGDQGSSVSDAESRDSN